MSPAVQVRLSRRAIDDFDRIARFWDAAAPELLSEVFVALNERIEWLRQGNYLLGTPLPAVGPRFRVVHEPRCGYAIFYRVDRDPALTVVTIRHGRQRPLRPATITRLGAP